MDGTCMNCGQVGNWCTCGDSPEVPPQLVRPVFTLPTTKKPLSTEPVRFRGVVDHHDGTGEHVLTGPHRHKEVAEDMSRLFIDDGRVSKDATVTVQSSHTTAAGVVTWHDQTVVQRPQGEKWKAYCIAHTICNHCGQVIQKGDE